MEVITIEKKTYEAMMERFRILTAKVDALCRECDEKRMGRWLDNQDVCQILNISLRTLQTYRSNRMLPYTQIGYKMFYKPEDVGKLLEQSSALCPMNSITTKSDVKYGQRCKDQEQRRDCALSQRERPHDKGNRCPAEKEQTSA